MLAQSIGARCVAALMLLAPFLAAQPAAAQKIKVRAAYVPAVTWLSAWVAKEEGYFDAQGLDVSFIAVQNISLVPGTVGKQLDIAPATVIDLINAAGGGLDVVAVAGNHSDTTDHVTSTIIVRKDSGIMGVKDFAGRTVATPTVGAILHIALLHWMKQEGVDVNSIRAVEVPFPNMPDQMKAGRVDVAEAVQPFASRMIAAGNVSLGDQLLRIANPARSTVWIADRAWAAAHRPVIAKWAAALDQARELIEKNPARARAVLAQYTKLPPGVADSIPLPFYDVTLRPQELDAWIKVMSDLGSLQKPLKGADLMIVP
ncbi:MAG TPA: ABC transporter substrate-binding protein [Xanthobacteraceae bacterium]